MADNDQQLAILLEAKIRDFERNMIKASKITGDQFGAMERRAQQGAQRMQGSLTAAGNVLTNDIKGRAESAAASLGTIGAALSALGPAGALVAAGFGGLWLAINRVSEGAKAFRQMARDIKEASEVTGLSTTQFQALSDVLQQHGVTAEQAAGALVKLNVERANAARGSGELYNALRRVNPRLAEEFASAKTAADAIGVFTKALQQADETTRMFLGRTAFGRGGAGIVPALLDAAGRGGIEAITDAAKKSGIAFDESVIRKQAEAAAAAERNARIVENNWNAAASAIAQRWKGFRDWIGLSPQAQLQRSIEARQMAERGLPMGERTLESLQEQAEKLRAQIAKFGPALDDNLNRPIGMGDIALQRLRIQLARVEEAIDAAKAKAATLTPAQRVSQGFEAAGTAPLQKPKSPVETTNDLERVITLEKQRQAVLGDTATIAERVALRQQEITLAQRMGVNVGTDEAKRVVEAYRFQLDAAREAIRVRDGVATETERLALKERELALAVAAGTMTEAERARAMAIYRQELREVVKFEAIRGSTTPQLSRLAVEANDLRANLDQNFAGALRGIGQEFSLLNAATGTFSDRLKNVSLRMADAVWQAILMKAVLGPLLKAFGFADGGFVSTAAGAGAAGLPGKADGGLIRGPGTSTSDSIPARLSNGEFVVRAAATAKFLPLLTAINAGRVQAFAAGGRAGAIQPAIASAGGLGGSTPTVAVNFGDINVNASGGTPAQNADLAKQIGKQIDVMVTAKIGEEIYRQMRPNGMLHSGTRRF